MKIICHRAQIFVTVQLKDFFNTSQCCVVLWGAGLCLLCVSGGAFMFHFNGLSLHCGHYLLDHLIAWFNSCCSVWGTSFIYCCHTSTSGNSAAGWPSHLWVVVFWGGRGSCYYMSFRCGLYREWECVEDGRKNSGEQLSSKAQASVMSCPGRG